MSYGFIYLTTNLLNGKQYIGMFTHEQKNKNRYLGSGKHLKNAIRLYGRENFSRTILEECATREELANAEIRWIVQFDAVNNPNFYNIQSGGYGGDPMVVKNMWEQRTTDERQLIGDKISNTRKLNESGVGSKNPMFGKSTSDFVKKVWDTRSNEKREEIANKVSKSRKEAGVARGSKNPMFGRSVIKEKNLKWYTNGIINKYVTEGTEPAGFVRGRTNISGKIGKRKNENA